MRKYFENNGHLNDKGVSLYVDALRLDKINTLPAEVTGHVEECTECKKAVVQLNALMEDTAPAADETHPFFDKANTSGKSRYFSVYRIAAAVAFFLLIGVLVFYVTRSPHVPDTFAENFEPFPLYESMVEQDFRSYGLEILSPGAGEEMRNGVTFQWEIRYDDQLIVSILDNRGEIVQTNTLTEDVYHFDDLLEPGLYYWRLETEERLLYVGKFIVPVDEE